ncbi:MAG: ABC transporter ATP-binding protein, partial [Rubritepida sp.]|nr:ABC transporter ATP-binding protein [Rubritepida sp.]
MLEVTGLSVTFATERGPLRAVDDVGLTLAPGRTLAIVGESGCGKSVTSLAIMGLLAANARATGRVVFEGRDLLTMPAAEGRRVRGGAMAVIFQEPMTSLNPAL